MKLKSLILGSVAAAGLSTAGFAADLGVLTSLDVCDALGLSGLTISSDTNCLQISGGVSYEFNFGDYRGETMVASTRGRFAWPGATNPGIVNYAAGPNASAAAPAQQGIWAIRNAAGVIQAVQFNGTTAPTQAQMDAIGGAGSTSVQVVAPVAAYAGGRNDWESKVEAWVKFVGSADSDFGVAKATIVLKQVDQQRVLNAMPAVAGGDNTPLQIDQAFVSVGDSTVIMAGKKGSVANFGDARPFNWAGLFGNNRNDGTLLDKDADANFLGGHVIQITSDLGNGVTAAAGLEKLETTGTAVGVISYAGEGITAHATGYARGILDGVVDSWGMHVGATATFDAFKVRGAFAADVTAANVTNWAGLIGAEATFDIFKIAADVEALGGSVGLTDYGVGGSVGAKVTEGVELNLGGKYYVGNNAGVTSYHVAAQIVAAVSESVKLTGEVGVWGNNTPTSDFYGKVGLDWAPGDATPKAAGFKAGVAGEVYQSGAYKLTFKASKTFE